MGWAISEMGGRFSRSMSIMCSPVGLVLTQGNGAQYWRSLDELAQTDRFQEMVTREFPEQASELDDDRAESAGRCDPRRPGPRGVRSSCPETASRAPRTRRCPCG